MELTRVCVRVPATSANVGPGFDSLGLALSLYNTVTFARADATCVTGAPAACCGEDNLALRAFRAAEEMAGADPCGVQVHIQADVPISRGLGSSATLLVAGAVGANALRGLGLTQQQLFTIVNRLEGHPDNVAPALFGGLCASLLEDEVPYTLPCPVHPSLRFCAFIPDVKTSTHRARTVLPSSVPYRDAVFNASHVAVLLPALASGDTVMLSRALQDRLHEPYRHTLIPEMDAVRAAALSAGAHAFFLSGSGSTCMAIYTDTAFPDRVRPALSPLTHAWQVCPLQLDTEGARVLWQE